MARPRTLALVLAGGKGGRLESLTTVRAKPAVPYGGHHRLVDVSLSNCAHSGIDEVWVSVQHNPVSLGEHLANGRPWDLDRNRGGMLVLHPRTTGEGRDGWSSGTADGLLRDADLIRGAGADALVVVSADAVYRLDYAAVVEEHRASGALVTMVTTRVDPADAGRYGVVQVEDGRVVDYALKPDDPQGDLVCNEVFVFDPLPVLELLEELAADAGEDGLQDLGHGLLPALVARGQAREHRFEGYWRDVGTLDAYHSSHMELLGADPAFRLDEDGWPVLTRGGKRGPSRLLTGAEVDDVLLSPSTTVAGRVERSVLSPGVVVEAGAVVRDSVLLHDTVVRSGATVTRAVLDAEVVVEGGAEVGAPDGELVLVGFGEHVRGRLAPGARQPSPG